jgi:hypothetical protein
MTIPRDDICDELEVDACLARLQLVAALRRLRQADTSENRAAAAECRARLDVILDLLVELRGTEPGRAAPVGRDGRQFLDRVPSRGVPGPRQSG